MTEEISHQHPELISTPDNDPHIRPFMPNFMRRINEIKPADIPQEEFVEIFDPLYNRYLIDGGLQKDAPFMYEGQVHPAPPVRMLGRSGLITHAEELNASYSSKDFGQDAGVHMSIMDIAKLRNMNYAGAGDYGINRVAATLQTKVEAINAKLREAKSGELAVGRIGGDEFMVFYFGVSESEAKSYFDEIVNPTDGVGAVKSFYKDSPDPSNTHEPDPRNVELKDEPFITIPTDGDRARVMWSYLHKGIILEPHHIDRIIELEKTGQIEAHPANFEGSVSERLARIVTVHPELKDIAHTVQNWSGRAEEAGGTYKRDDATRDFVDFVEGVVYDRLLGENVRSIDDLNAHALSGDLSEMFVFDFKGLKELNDYVSLVDGDHAIQATFNAISDVVKSADDNQQDESENVMYFRRGGTIVVAGRRRAGSAGDSALSETKRAKLRSIQTISIDDRDVNPAYDLGVSYGQLQQFVDTSPETVARGTGIMLESAERSWYGKMAEDLVMRGDGSDTDSINSILSYDAGATSQPSTTAELADRVQLMKLFFHGKRRIERMTQLRSVVHNQMEYVDADKATKLFGLRGIIDTLLKNER